MGFSLSTILPAALAVGGSLLAGMSESKTAGPKGYTKKGSSTSLGFLGDILGKGASAYVESQKDGADDFGVPQIETPRIQRFSGQAPRVGMSPALQNSRVQLALQNIFGRMNTNNQLQQMVRDSGVPMTTRTGRRTLGLEAPRTPSATKTKLASVKTAPEE